MGLQRLISRTSMPGKWGGWEGGIVTPLHARGDSGNALPAEGVRPVHPNGGQAVCGFVQAAPDSLPREDPSRAFNLP
eukprot:5869436-Pyramimonas_sp.AAC.1